MARTLLRVLATITTAAIATAVLNAPAQALDATVITGVVFSNSGGGTVTDGCVTVFQADTPVEVNSGCVDISGQFTIPVEPGAYKLRIRAASFPEQWYFERSTFERATRLDIDEAGRLVFIGLLDGFGDITGRIVTSEGIPVENADVTSTSVANGGQRSTSTDANGEYTLVDLAAPGQYTIFIHTNGLGSQWVFATKVFEEAEVFDLANGQVLVVNDALLPLSTVEVIMVDERNHQRITRGCVQVHQGFGGETCVNVNGVFTVRNVPADFYQVEAQPEGTHWPATTELQVEPGQTHRVTITVERATAFVTTVVESATGRPAAGVCIQFAEPNLTPALFIHGCSAADGRLVIGPLEGTVKKQLYALHPDNLYGAQWVTADGGSGDQRRAKIFTSKNDKATDIPPIRIDPPGSITGVVRDQATGNPLARVCAFPFALSSTDALDRQVGPHCSNANGQYTINGLGPYAWPVLYIAVGRSQYAWLWSGGASDRFAAQYIQVQPGQSSTADLSMVASGTISGRALKPTGEATFAHAIIARNARTGDLAAPPTTTTNFTTGAYQLRALATQQVKIEYFISSMTCWYDRVQSAAYARPVQVQSGVETTGIDLVDCAG
jgi:hypothetical protein